MWSLSRIRSSGVEQSSSSLDSLSFSAATVLPPLLHSAVAARHSPAAHHETIGCYSQDWAYDAVESRGQVRLKQLGSIKGIVNLWNQNQIIKLQNVRLDRQCPWASAWALPLEQEWEPPCTT